MLSQRPFGPQKPEFFTTPPLADTVFHLWILLARGIYGSSLMSPALAFSLYVLYTGPYEHIYSSFLHLTLSNYHLISGKKNFFKCIICQTKRTKRKWMNMRVLQKKSKENEIQRWAHFAAEILENPHLIFSKYAFPITWRRLLIRVDAKIFATK